MEILSPPKGAHQLMSTAPLLTVEGLTASYGESAVLRGVDLVVRRGAVTTVMGRNGVGKSTLLRTIMGLVKVQSGSIWLNATTAGVATRPEAGDIARSGTGDGPNAARHELSRLTPFRIARAGVGYVPQGREILPRLTVLENLRLGLEAAPDHKPRMSEDELYALFPILKEFRRRPGGNLSGGQQQQLAIARALISGPSLLLLDEPTEGIQPSIAIEIGEIVKRLAQERGIAVLLVEQKIDFARHVTDYFYCMDRGRMTREGPAATFDFHELQQHIAV
jgi:urea transport system ATP-binding protein